jgi:hypothetical protein
VYTARLREHQVFVSADSLEAYGAVRAQLSGLPYIHIATSSAEQILER